MHNSNSGSNRLLMGAFLLGPTLIFSYLKREEIADRFAQRFPAENVQVNIEPILKARDYIPEEFYLKLFRSDDFILVGEQNCKPPTCRTFTNLDGEYHDTDLYTFALHSVSSGHRPINKQKKVRDDHYNTVTWLDVVRTLTHLSPEDSQDQNHIRSLIATNSNMMLKGNHIDPTSLYFKENEGSIVDILYNELDKNVRYTVTEYISGSYRTNDYKWVPSGRITKTYPITDKTGHFILPPSNQPSQMLIVPDYFLRDDIILVDAAVYTGRGKYSKYKISVEELEAELNVLRINRERITSWEKMVNGEVIITPTLELVVSDITRNQKTLEGRKAAIIKTLSKEPYADTEYNTSPLVTLIAGGQCGATAGQVAAMFHLAGIKDFSFVHFKEKNHVGIYGPLNSGLPHVPRLEEYDQYWYLETTNGSEGNLVDYIEDYGPPNFSANIPPVFDLRSQLRHMLHK